MSKSVVILGGGIAGLSAGVFLSDKGYNVSIYESSPKWGGRAYSFFDKDMNELLDNGRHVLAGFYENTFEFMKKIGTYDKLLLKNKLELVLCEKNDKYYRLAGTTLPGVWSLLSGIFRFKGFSFDDKLKFLNLRKLNLKNDSNTANYEKMNASEILDSLKQTPNLKKYFWHPFIYAAFNTAPDFVSGKLFLELLKKGTENKKNMSVILGDDNLNSLFIDKSLCFLKSRNAFLVNNLGGKIINISDNKVSSVILSDGSSVTADHFICAVPFYNFENLFSPEYYKDIFPGSVLLKNTCIISIRISFNTDVSDFLKYRMTGLVDSTAQWVFKESDRSISIVISGADVIDGLLNKSAEEIYRLCINDLKKAFTNFDENKIISYKIIKEKRAAFLPDKESEKFRFMQKCNIENLYIAGDWTDTGLPATLEGAVKSAKICSEIIINKN